MDAKKPLLIVDDDEDIRSQMKWALLDDYEVQLAEDRPSALSVFAASHPEVVILDLGLPPAPGEITEGLATLSEMLRTAPHTKVIIASGQSDRSNALKAISEGAYDFLAKPVQMEEIKVLLKRAYYLAQLEKDKEELEKQLLSTSTFQGMLGTSRQMQEVFNSIRKVANTEAPVLILGESGTGKERAAQAIHNLSTRKNGPFVAINCGAIPESLLESELFGHEKGAFTGAHAQRLGKFETAQEGTLFLDEVGELPQPLQVKMLRFLQERVIQRIGGRKDIPIDCRVITATNVDLKKATMEGKFREDLFYRIAVVILRLPPLRERSGDAALLAQAFLKRFSAESGKEKLRFSSNALKAIQNYNWPGNVRELENRVRRAIIMAEKAVITEADLEITPIVTPIAATSLKVAREALENEMA
ncbi:MAG: PEP-CTERM-box response regulator transcription factor, partial [Verrucomicrobiota bacterium]